MIKARLAYPLIVLVLAGTGGWLWIRARPRAQPAIPTGERTEVDSATARDSLVPNERSVAASESATPAERSLTGLQPPANAAELQALVRRIQGMSREELLQLTNAEYGFQDSELIRALQKMEGDWVIDELARLSIAETDDLVRATLTVGLFGGFNPSRIGDPRLLTAAQDMLPLFVSATTDPFQAASSLVMGINIACLRQ
jgi:hypothetical protein